MNLDQNFETYESIMLKLKGVKQTQYFWPNYIKWFAKSSGTTNAKSKFIPVGMSS